MISGRKFSAISPSSNSVPSVSVWFSWNRSKCPAHSRISSAPCPADWKRVPGCGRRCRSSTAATNSCVVPLAAEPAEQFAGEDLRTAGMQARVVVNQMEDAHAIGLPRVGTAARLNVGPRSGGGWPTRFVSGSSPAGRGRLPADLVRKSARTHPAAGLTGQSISGSRQTDRDRPRIRGLPADTAFNLGPATRRRE